MSGQSSKLEREVAYRKFAEEWLTNGFDGTAAVLSLWPDLTEESARNKAYRLLTSATVREIVFKEELTLKDLREMIEAGAKIALDKGDLTNYSRAIENLVKMQGGFKEVVESTNKHSFVDEKEKEELAKLRQGIAFGDN